MCRQGQYNIACRRDLLGLPSHIAVKKPLLASAMKKKRIDFCNKCKSWTEEEWKNVLFSDELCFYVINSAGKEVRRPRGSHRCDPKYTVEIVKHAAYTIIRGGAVSVAVVAEDRHFFPETRQ